MPKCCDLNARSRTLIGVSATATDDDAQVVKLREPNADDWYGNESSRRPPLGAEGASGTSWSGGTISGYERQASLRGSLWAKESVQMRRTDGRLAASWGVRKQTALTASWKWEPGQPDDPDSERYAAYANEAFGFVGGAGHLGCTWEHTLEQMLEYVPVGFRYLEEVYHLDRDRDGEMRWWVTYEDREPTAHDSWVKGHDEALVEVTQNPPGAPRTRINSRKIVLLTRGLTGANFEGVGVDRAIWWVWRLKRHLLDSIGVGVARWSSPVIEAIINRRAALGDVEPEPGESVNTAIAALRDAILQQAERIQATDESVVWHPEWIELKQFGGPGSMDWAGLQVWANWCDAEMAANYTVEAQRLGLTETGSRAVGEVHQQTLHRVVSNDLDTIASEVGGPSRPGGGTIGRLIEWNFGRVPEAKLPRLVHTGLQPDRFADAQASIPGAIAAGVLTPDEGIENLYRSHIGAEPLREGQRAAAQAASRAPDSGSLVASLADRIYEESRPRGQMEMPL